MQNLTETQLDLLISIYNKLVRCEGGLIEFGKAKSGAYYFEVVIAMPRALWCEECIKRKTCITKLLRRWGTGTYLFGGIGNG